MRFIYHIAHPRTLDWDSLLDNLQAAGLSFDRVSPSKWLERVEASSEDTEENPSIQMLSMWQAAVSLLVSLEIEYRESDTYPDDQYGYESIVQPQPEVDTTQAQAACKTLRNALPIDSAQIELMVKAWRRTGFLA